MNPYERTAEEMKRQSEGPKRFGQRAVELGTTGLLTAGAAAFTPILSRAAPFLSQYIPEDLAIKGLSKISPKFGNFVKKAMDNGFDFNEVKDFIGEQVAESQQAKENRNIIEQYDPELHQYIKMKLGEGLNLIEAGKKALGHSRFRKAIEKLTKDHKTSWDAILKTVFGHSKKVQPNQQQQQQPQQMQQQPQPGQMSPGQAAIMAQLEKINQRFGQ